MTLDFDLQAHTILLVLSGSRAYGLHTETSDVDIKGVAIPPSRYFHGFLHTFEQADDAEGLAAFAADLHPAEREQARQSKLEGAVYALGKLARLAADSNPNLLEVLFCREAEVRRITPAGRRLRESARLFLSRRVRHSFAGYAASQLGRIQGHRRWLLHPPTHAPTRGEFGLPQRTLIPADQLAAAEAAVRAKVDGWEIDFGRLEKSEVIHIQGQVVRMLAEIGVGMDERWISAARSIGYDENFMALLDRERRYRAARREWQQYADWRQHRNPARAAMEARAGYDCKHAMHLVRLLKMCAEILEYGEVWVWRGGRDDDELCAIRAGEWSFDVLMGWVGEQEARIEALYRSEAVALPRQPDREAIDALVVSLVEDVLTFGQ